MELNLPLLSQLMLHKTHHTRYIAHCEKGDILSSLTTYYMSWVGLINKVVVRRKESFLY